jgi:CHASE2 domain-containing sensor protein
LELNGATFTPLNQHFGGYRGVDDAGYQILMQYRGENGAFPTLSLSDVLSGQFTADMIRDRIVIIGTTAPSAKDLFYTPYSEDSEADFLMPGVMLHAHATSQILATALDQQRLPWAFPEAAEVGWIILWGITGGILGSTIKRTWLLGLCLLAGGTVLVIVPGAVFTLGGWLPLLPASAAFVGTVIAAGLSRNQLPPQRSRAISTQANTPSLMSLPR